MLALSMSFAFTSCGEEEDGDTSFMEEDKDTSKDQTADLTPGFKFATNSDGTYRITKYVSDGETKNLVIDAIYERAAVTEIDARAFENLAILESVTIPEGISVIGDYAFAGCTGLTEIVIPTSVTSIGSHAFYGCNNLADVVIENCEDADDDLALAIGDYAFAGCTALRGKGNADDGFVFSLSERVASIGKAAFFGCAQITSLALPDSLVSIGESAFQNCSTLKTVTSGAGSNLESIGANAFRACAAVSEFTVPAKVETIGHDAFRDCAALATLNINSSLQSVGSYAFYGCSLLKTVNAPDVESWLEISFADIYANPIFKGTAKLYVNDTLVEDVDTGAADKIGSYSFYMYPHLKSVTVTESVKSIGRCAFYCTGIDEVVIADGVESVGEYAFAGCGALASATIGKGVKTLGRAAFADCQALTSISFKAIKMKDMKADNMVFANVGKSASLTIVIDKDVTYIPAYFVYSSANTDKLPALSAVTFENESSCLGIGEAAFKNASKVIGIALPDSLETIGNYAFENCSQLSSVKIGENVKSVGTGAYAGCDRATYIYFLAKNMADLAPANRVFENVGKQVACTYVVIGEKVEKIPANLFYSADDLAKLPVIEGVETDNTVFTAIGEGAFKNASINEIVLPESLLSIGASAFKGSMLEEIAIPNSVISVGDAAFASCSALEKIEIGAGLALIKPDYFSGSYKINSIAVSLDNDAYFSQGNCVISAADRIVVLGCSASSLPSDVVGIGDEAFAGCTGLTEINIPDNVTSIGEKAFYSSGITAIAIPDSVISLGASAFADCSAATTLSIGKGVSAIAPLCFVGCSALEIITVSSENTSLVSVSNCVLDADKTTLLLGCKNSSLTGEDFAQLSTISDNAFAGCTGLSSITLPDTVYMVGDNAFAGCTGLTSIQIGSSLSEIFEGAFAGCIGIESITISEDNTFFAVINGCLVNTDAKLIITACKEFSISENMMLGSTKLYPTIGKYAFAGRTDITELQLPASYLGINESAFEGCVNLTSIKIPVSVGTLEDNVFKNCPNLEIYFDVAAPDDLWGNYNPDNLPTHFKSAE